VLILREVKGEWISRQTRPLQSATVSTFNAKGMARLGRLVGEKRARDVVGTTGAKGDAKR
jgi:hypothetical protein